MLLKIWSFFKCRNENKSQPKIDAKEAIMMLNVFLIAPWPQREHRARLVHAFPKFVLYESFIRAVWRGERLPWIWFRGHKVSSHANEFSWLIPRHLCSDCSSAPSRGEGQMAFKVQPTRWNRRHVPRVTVVLVLRTFSFRSVAGCSNRSAGNNLGR